MNQPKNWQLSNEHYLSTALTWLRSRLLLCCNSEGVTAEEVALAQAIMLEAEETEPPPALIHLSQQLGLYRFEQNILLLCAAMALDTQIANLCARVHNDSRQPYPTFALALGIFENPAWNALSPERPLRYWRLIEIHQSGVQPITTSPLRTDERIVNYLKRLNYLDDRLNSLVFTLNSQGIFNTDIFIPLPDSQQAVVDAITNHLQQAVQTQRFPIIQLLGANTPSKQLVAWHACEELGLQLYRLPVELLPTQAADLETFSRLWQRESLLLPLALYIDVQMLDDTTNHGEKTAALRQFLAHSNGIFFLDSREVGFPLERATVSLDVAKPTPSEQRQLWEVVLSGEWGLGTGDWELGTGTSLLPPARCPLLGAPKPPAPCSQASLPVRLAGQFNLNLAEIGKIGQASLGEPDRGNRIWLGCLASTRPKLDTLAQRIDAKATWDDIVLPREELDLLQQIANQVRQRSLVYDDWGFRQRMNRGLGVNAMFAGESGTGKTMAAEVLANDLCLNLYRIDLSAVVSKYIGETEKNLRRLFDAAEDGGAILFFDEADALFGKRSEVKDSHDRYANIEINYLLQRIEAYRGLSVLATNLKSSLDTAFLRRLRFVITFPFPAFAERKRLWQKAFPPDTPVANLDVNRLGRLNLAGGNIHNIAINAAFLAAKARDAVTMHHILAAARTEYRKLERPINEADFIWEEEEEI
jgi:hypothetical protein